MTFLSITQLFFNAFLWFWYQKMRTLLRIRIVLRIYGSAMWPGSYSGNKLGPSKRPFYWKFIINSHVLQRKKCFTRKCWEHSWPTILVDSFIKFTFPGVIRIDFRRTILWPSGSYNSFDIKPIMLHIKVHDSSQGA